MIAQRSSKPHYSKQFRCSSTSIQRPRSWRLQGSKTIQLLCKGRGGDISSYYLHKCGEKYLERV